MAKEKEKLPEANSSGEELIKVEDSVSSHFESEPLQNCMKWSLLDTTIMFTLEEYFLSFVSLSFYQIRNHLF